MKTLDNILLNNLSLTTSLETTDNDKKLIGLDM